MDKKTPFVNRTIALFLSVICIITFQLSFLTFPFELVLFNANSYTPVLENDENLARYPIIISDLLTDQLFERETSAQQPKLFLDKEKFKSVLANYVSTEWSLSTFKSLTSHIVNYLNFRIPDSSIKLDISQMKNELILNSTTIVSDYISSLPNCSAASVNVDLLLSNAPADIYELPPCKPKEQFLQKFSEPAADYFEDAINRLPGTVSVTGMMTIDKNKTDQVFYYYSLSRWILRLLPILTISLLIFIALLLRSERKVMLGWIGKLLVFSSGIGLIAVIILFIGFDQFVILVMNPFFNQLVDGIDVLSLGIIQKIGYLTLVWVIVSELLTLIFGLFLLLVKRFIKPQKISRGDPSTEIFDDARIDIETETSNDAWKSQKEIEPETLEEIEEREKKPLKSKKAENQKK